VGWFGVLLSFAGVALIASGEGEGIRLSPQALVILSAALTSSVYMIMQKHYLGRYSALEFTAYSIWFGTLLMLPFGRGFVHSLRAAPAAATLSVIYLGIFPGSVGLCRMGVCDVPWHRRTHCDSALPDSGHGHWHRVGVAGRGAPLDFLAGRSYRAGWSCAG
jgi:hypothetical protein